MPKTKKPEISKEKKTEKLETEEKDEEENEAEEIKGTEEMIEKTEKLEKIKEKAKKLAEKLEKDKEERDKKEKDEKEKIRENEKTEKLEKDKKKKEEKAKKSEKTLIPLEEYITAGAHLGKKVITPHIRPFVYRRRADGIAILNTTIIDEKLKKAAEFLSKYNPEEIIVVCKREAGWNAVKLFSQLTGIKSFTKKYPAGVLTNIALPDFFETEVVLICDPWVDKNALKDAKRVNKKVVALCDSNNLTFGVDVVIPCNNKGGKSLGLIFYILAREYLKERKIKVELPDLKEFFGEETEESTEKIHEKITEKNL